MSLIDYSRIDICLNTTEYDKEIRNMFETSIQKTIENYSDNPNISGSLIYDGIQALNAADNASRTLSNKNPFKKFVGIFSGGNSKLRDFSNQHLREAQRATFKLIEQLADNNMILMDAIKINQQAIQYLVFKNNCLKENLLQIFNTIDNRFQIIEREILNHRYRINLLEFSQELDIWNKELREPNYFKSSPGTFTRIYEIAKSMFVRVESILQSMNQEDTRHKYGWNSRIITHFRDAVRVHSGFSTSQNGNHVDYTASIDKLIEIIYTEQLECKQNISENGLINDYPVEYLKGSTRVARIFYLINHAIMYNLSLEEVKGIVKDSLEIDINSEISWVDIGQELLLQMKLLNDERHLRFCLEGLILETRQSFYELLTNDQKQWLDSNDRIQVFPQLAHLTTPFEKYEIIKGSPFRVNVCNELEIDEKKNISFKLLIEFVNPQSYLTENILNNFADKNRLNIKEKYTLSNNNYFEYGFVFSPNWIDWPNEQNIYGKQISKLFNELELLIG